MIAIIKIIFCFFMLALAAFTQIPLLQYDAGIDAFTNYDYSLLYIACFVLSLCFRNNYAFVAVLAYLLLGLAGLPIFAFGGGWTYIFEPSFGYLLGLFPLSILAFYQFVHVDDFPFKTFKERSLGPLLGILAAHLFGLVFLLLTGNLDLNNFLDMGLYQFIYDLVFASLILSFVPNRHCEERSEPVLSEASGKQSRLNRML